jgi:hypothetical protein
MPFDPIQKPIASTEAMIIELKNNHFTGSDGHMEYKPLQDGYRQWLLGAILCHEGQN